MAKPRPEKVRGMYRKAKRLAPGLYVMRDGQILWNITEVLEEIGMPDSDENRLIVRDIIKNAARELGLRYVYLGGVEGS